MPTPPNISLKPGSANEASDLKKSGIRLSLQAVVWTNGVPSDSFGGNGETAVDYNTGIIYRKSAGAWSAMAGPSGTAWYAVTGTPANSFGSNGDFALLYTGGTVTALLTKSSGTWSTLATFAQPAVLPTDSNRLIWNHEFMGGADIVATGLYDGVFSYRAVSGSGSCRPGATPSRWGTAILATAAVRRNAVALTLDENSSTSATQLNTALLKKASLSAKFLFKLDATTNFFRVGFSNALGTGDAASNPATFIGIRAVPVSSAWQASTAYALGQFVRPTAGNGRRYACTTAGTTGGTEPTWPTSAGGTVNDGGAVWTEAGAEGSANFHFVVRDNSDATEVAANTADSGIPVDTGWHELEVGWTGSQWRMRLDQGSWSNLAAKASDRNVAPSFIVAARDASVASLQVDRFALYAERPVP